MTRWSVHKKDFRLDRADEDEEYESEEVILERRMLRKVIGVITLIVGLGLVFNALITILDHLNE